MKKKKYEYNKKLTKQVVMGEGRRIVVPADLCEALHFKKGDVLTMSIEDGELKVTTHQQAMQKLRDMVRPFKDKESMVDDFLSHRKEMWGEE